jgi:hypothetical protein
MWVATDDARVPTKIEREPGESRLDDDCAPSRVRDPEHAAGGARQLDAGGRGRECDGRRRRRHRPITVNVSVAE